MSDSMIWQHKYAVPEKGYFDINESPEQEDYPGIDIEFVPNGELKKTASLPRVVFEFPKDGKLRLLIWDDPDNEDFSHKIEFDISSYTDEPVVTKSCYETVIKNMSSDETLTSLGTFDTDDVKSKIKKTMNRDDILQTIKNLASSQGLYGRLLKQLTDLKETDEKKYEELMQKWEDEKFQNPVEFVLFIEG